MNTTHREHLSSSLLVIVIAAVASTGCNAGSMAVDGEPEARRLVEKRRAQQPADRENRPAEDQPMFDRAPRCQDPVDRLQFASWQQVFESNCVLCHLDGGPAPRAGARLALVARLMQAAWVPWLARVSWEARASL